MTAEARELQACPWCDQRPDLTKHFREDMYSLLHRCKVVGPILFDWGDKERHIERWNRTPSPGYADGLEAAQRKCDERSAAFIKQAEKCHMDTLYDDEARFRVKATEAALCANAIRAASAGGKG